MVEKLEGSHDILTHTNFKMTFPQCSCDILSHIKGLEDVLFECHRHGILYESHFLWVQIVVRFLKICTESYREKHLPAGARYS